eukprot:Opistho-1_new@25923
MGRKRQEGGDADKENKPSEGGFAAELESLFGTRDLYAVLGAERDTDGAGVKKAYRRRAIECHPDKAAPEERDAATQKFQALARVYKILGDEESRKVYNETGVIDDEDSRVEAPADGDWDAWFRMIFVRVDSNAIAEFEKKYKGSEEEREDLKKAYLEAKGDMGLIIDNVLCATVDDEDRFRDILTQEIQAGNLKSYKKFSKESDKERTSRRKHADEEAAEAEKEKKRLGLGDGHGDLAALIQRRNTQRADSVLASLEAKYGGKGKKKRTLSEPTEEEFEAAAARVARKTKKAGK